jgi:hypothetical protein
MKRFSDFADEPLRLDGDKVRINEILNKEIKIVGYAVRKSKYGKDEKGRYATIQFEEDNSMKKIFFTGSDVLINQLEKYGNQVPFIAVIKKIDKYYTFT